MPNRLVADRVLPPPPKMIELQEGGKAVISFTNDPKERKTLYDRIAKYVTLNILIAFCEAVWSMSHCPFTACGSVLVRPCIHRGLKSKETHHTYLKAVQECQTLLSTVLVRISLTSSCFQHCVRMSQVCASEKHVFTVMQCVTIQRKGCREGKCR